MSVIQEIQTLLEAFQDGYVQRDVSQLDTFMEMFTPNVEVIGTPGLRPGVNEWYTDRDGARELMVIDFETWGDVLLDMQNASIHVNGDTGWVAVPATVTIRIGDEKYTSFLETMKEYLEKSSLSPKQKLQVLLREGTNTIYELDQGEEFVWPLRITAVVVKQDTGWKFAQMNFSFPSENIPGARIVGDTYRAPGFKEFQIS